MGAFDSRMSEEGKRMSRILSAIITFLLFLAVLLYAGFRGYNAYHHDPDSRTVWQARTQIDFPAITFCPLGVIPLTPVECVLEVKEVHTNNCLSSAVQTAVYFEGVTKNCWTFNSNAALKVNSIDDELAIGLSLNFSQYGPDDEPLMGALVIVHSSTVGAVISHETSFAVDVGKVTEAWLQRYETNLINGTMVPTYVQAQVSSVSVWNPKVNSTVDVDFVFTDGPGAYVVTQYYSYTVDIWIGEVGGFACLMLFLHMAVMFLIDIPIMFTKPNQGGAARLREDL